MKPHKHQHFRISGFNKRGPMKASEEDIKRGKVRRKLDDHEMEKEMEKIKKEVWDA